MPEPSITPLARQLAEENGIDWQQVKGSGPGGAIGEEDILDYLVQVMAGEVSLPPDPNEPISSGKLAADLGQVQAAMAREGIDIENLVPPTLNHSQPTEVDIDFEVDFSSFEENGSSIAANSWESDSSSGGDEDEESWFNPSPTQAAATHIAEESPQFSGGFIDGSLAFETTEEATLEIEEELSLLEEELEEEPSWVSDAGPSLSSGEETINDSPTSIISDEGELESQEDSSWIGGEDVYFPEPEIIIGSRIEPTPTPTFTPVPSSIPVPSSVGAGSALLIPAGFNGEVVPIFRQSVDLSAAQKASRDLSQAWGEAVTSELFLFKASLQALADFEVPLRGVKGYFTTNTVQAYGVKPGGNLRETWNRLKSAHESGEGLWVFYLLEGPCDDITVPGKPTLALGPLRITGSEGKGLLSLSGPVPTNSQILLERVAHYFERPILLA